MKNMEESQIEKSKHLENLEERQVEQRKDLENTENCEKI